MKSKSLARNGATALAIRLTGAGGLLLVHILLARCLGVGGFGDYSLALVWLQFLCVFGKSGLDNTTLRYVSEYTTNRDQAALRGFTRLSTRFAWIISCLVSAGFLGAIYIQRESLSPNLAASFAVAAIMIPLICVRQVQEAAIRARGLIIQSQISTTIWPILLLLLVAIVRIALPRQITAVEACVLHLLAIGSVALYISLVFRRSVAAEHGTADLRFEYRTWLLTGLAFFGAELLVVLKSRACIALAGTVLGRDAAGLYSAMERFADASVLGSQSLGLVIAPQFASLYAAGRFSEMRKLMRHGQLLVFASTFPIALGVACFSNQIFTLLGTGYREGWPVLMMLLLSICIASFAGPAAYVLQMSGRERLVMIITGICTISNIVFGLIFIRPLGILGLGVAQVVTSIIWTIGIRACLSLHPAWAKDAVDQPVSTLPPMPEVEP